MTTETRWHRHWYITVRETGKWYHWLRKARFRTTNQKRAEKSIFVWGVYPCPHGTIYTLSILGILHGLTGLTLRWEDGDE